MAPKFSKERRTVTNSQQNEQVTLDVRKEKNIIRLSRLPLKSVFGYGTALTKVNVQKEPTVQALSFCSMLRYISRYSLPGPCFSRSFFGVTTWNPCKNSTALLCPLEKYTVALEGERRVHIGMTKIRVLADQRNGKPFFSGSDTDVSQEISRRGRVGVGDDAVKRAIHCVSQATSIPIFWARLCFFFCGYHDGSWARSHCAAWEYPNSAQRG